MLWAVYVCPSLLSQLASVSRPQWWEGTQRTTKDWAVLKSPVYEYACTPGTRCGAAEVSRAEQEQELSPAASAPQQLMDGPLFFLSEFEDVSLNTD